MGTRALIHIKDKGVTLLTIYRQFDGYPSGLGQELGEILSGQELPSGYIDDKSLAPSFYNGMGCLAAYIVKELKEKWGNVYIYPVDSQDVGEDYVYIIEESGDDKKLTLVTLERQ